MKKFPSRTQNKIIVAAMVCFVAVLSITAWAPANNSPASERKPERSGAGSKQSPKSLSNILQREGTKIVDEEGYFRLEGDRVIFFATNPENRYVALENLNLERVAKALEDQHRRRRWRVTGTLTEYQGNNYLLIEKAMLESWDDKQQRPQ